MKQDDIIKEILSWICAIVIIYAITEWLSK